MIHFNFEFCNFFLHQFDDSLDESIGTTLEKMQYNVFREIRIRIHFFHSFANDDRNQKKKKGCKLRYDLSHLSLSRYDDFNHAHSVYLDFRFFLRQYSLNNVAHKGMR